MTIYDPKVDLVNGNVYTKFGFNKSIRSQDIEKKEFFEKKMNSLKKKYSDVNQGP